MLVSGKFFSTTPESRGSEGKGGLAGRKEAVEVPYFGLGFALGGVRFCRVWKVGACP